jgi:polar amino acid transport system permease protein
MIDLDVVVESLPGLMDGFLNTLWLCLVSAILALVCGSLLALADRSGIGWLRALIAGYTLTALSMPLLVLLYLLFFVLPEFGVTLSSNVVGVAGLALYYSPYVSQVILGALQAIPEGQFEAGKALGVPQTRLMIRLIIPQMLPLLLPSLTGLLIGLIKDSALLSIISVNEFMYASKVAVANTYAPLEIYIVVGLGYWLLTGLVDELLRKLEARSSRHFN